MVDVLTISYEEFPEENITVMTVGRGDEALWMFHDEQAKRIHRLLLGDTDLVVEEKIGPLSPLLK